MSLHHILAVPQPGLALKDCLGYLAAGLVFMTFSVHSMRALRLIAILSNVAFISYASAAHLTPILLLHGVLLPTNLARLGQIEWARRVRPLAEPAGRMSRMMAVAMRRTRRSSR